MADGLHSLSPEEPAWVGEGPGPTYRTADVQRRARERLWQDFCHRHQILEQAVPLFAERNGEVLVRSHGRDARPLLQRSEAMERMVVEAASSVIRDFLSGADHYEGLLYLMCWRVEGSAQPLYLGKAEKFGRRGNLSANLEGVIRGERFKFCRWGDGYAYHIGDLSAVVCNHPGHQTRKYERWAQTLFASRQPPRLVRPVWFWMTPWRRGEVGPWVEFGETQLTFAEYLLIGLAGSISADLLNDEGVNRLGE